MADKPTIFLGMPFFPGSLEMESVLGIVSAQSPDYHLIFVNVGGSNTAKAFNMLWSQALNACERGDVAYFAMLHADCCPKGPWLQTLWSLLHENRLDLISVVSPIKNQHGLTSCGCDYEQGNPWKVRRFTSTEIARLPETFDVTDAIAAGLNPAGTPLLVNTGCMLLDLSNPKWHEVDVEGDLQFRFTFYDRIRRFNGQWAAQSISEDWDWSRMMAASGMRYAATRKVRLDHMGRWPYKNTGVWGDWPTDLAHPELAECAYSEDDTPLAETAREELEPVG